MSTPNHDTELEEILENMFMVGVQHAERTIPEIDKLQEKAKVALHTYLYKETLELIPKDWPVDTNEGQSPLMTFNKARNSAYAEMRKAAAERWGQ